MGKSISAKDREIEEKLRERNLFPNTSAPWQQTILDKLLINLTRTRNETCLDAACGIGNNIQTLLKYFSNIQAFDHSTEAIEYAKECYAGKDKSIIFRISELEHTPFKTNSIPFVICTEALEHVSDCKAVVAELYRIISPDGLLVLSFQNHSNLSALIKFIAEKVNKVNWDVWGTHCCDGEYESYINCFQVKRLVKAAGFSIIKEFGADYINAWLSWIPFFYKNYTFLNKHPLLLLGKVPLLKHFGMDYFLILKKQK